MYRVLAYCLVAFPAAAFAVWLATREGRFSADWLGYHIEMNTSLAVVVYVALILLVLLIVRWTGLVVRGPETFFAYRRERRKALGLSALSKGMVAVAAGDSAEVRKLAKQAHKLLDEPQLTLLLSAQAAQLDGDERKAESFYREMLDAEATEFLGLRGLFMIAARRGDREAAYDYASRAYELRPDTPWVFDALFELNSVRHNWAGAADMLESSVKAKHIGQDVAKRKRAVLYTEQARAEDEAGHGEAALEMAQKALGLAPGFTPAAVIAAKYLIEEDQLWKAAQTIETAWSVAPHPDLARAYAKVKAGEDPRARARWMRGLAKFNKDHVESRLLRARQNVKLGNWKGARKALTGLVEDFPSVRVCELMADIEKGEHGPSEVVSEAARQWLAKAVHAPRDAHWMCGTCGREAPGWSAVCPNCGAFDDLTWRAPEMTTLTPLEDDDDFEDEADAMTLVSATSPEEVPPTGADVVRSPARPAKETAPKAPPTYRSRRDEAAPVLDDPDVAPIPDDPGPGGDDPFDPRPEKVSGRDF